jgi:hypothetical protein
MIKKINDNTAKICCSGNCSSISVSEEGVTITDDFGHSVLIPEDEALEISAAVKQIKSWKS